MSQNINDLLNKYHQQHLLLFSEKNSANENKELLADIQNVNFPMICKDEYFAKTQCSESIDKFIEPLDSHIHQSIRRTSKKDIENFRKIGLEEISKGTVAALLLAGGQGTRLGSNLPKGMFDVGLTSGKTLYQIQAEKIYRLQGLAKEMFGKSASIPWYIMTSEHTMEPTVEFFKKKNYFNLDKDNIIVFEQNCIPCFNFEGKIILNKPYKIARAPDGNGGLYEAIRKKGILDDMKKRGIKHIYVYCVDNILVKVADPIFIGYCISKNTECGTKVIEKVCPSESLGIICKINGKFKVVEYSEVSKETSEKRNANGQLLFNAGNICNHYFTLNFLIDKVKEDELKYHIAKKKIPFVDSNGTLIQPETVNGIKLEKFVFDVFQFASPEKFSVWEVLREDEFSPLKNNDKCDRDTPTTARVSLYNLHQRYVLNAGGKFVDNNGQPVPLLPSPTMIHDPNVKMDSDNNKNQIICEISPLISYDGENLEPLVNGKTFQSGVHLK